MMTTSSRPYLVRAIYEWIVDNGCTPYISADTTSPRVDVPREYIKNDSITLDISSVATTNLLVNNEAITFNARFGGVMHSIYIPISSVLAIYAQENNNGMAFPPEEFEDEFQADAEETEVSSSSSKPQFKIVSGGKDKD